MLTGSHPALFQMLYEPQTHTLTLQKPQVKTHQITLSHTQRQQAGQEAEQKKNWACLKSDLTFRCEEFRLLENLYGCFTAVCSKSYTVRKKGVEFVVMSKEMPTSVV